MMRQDLELTEFSLRSLTGRKISKWKLPLIKIKIHFLLEKKEIKKANGCPIILKPHISYLTGSLILFFSNQFCMI